MSEGYTIEDHCGTTAGIVVRPKGERGFRFMSSYRFYDAMDGQVFTSAEAAQRAARDLAKSSLPRYHFESDVQGVAA